MSDWYHKYEENVFNLLKDEKNRDLRFFRIEEMLRMAKRADKFAFSCTKCQSFKNRLNEEHKSLKKAVQYPGKERKELDLLQTEMSAHMKKIHGFYPPYYFSYLYSTIGIIIFMAIAFLFYLFLPTLSLWNILAVAFATGVIIGQITGHKRDNKIKREEKNL